MATSFVVAVPPRSGVRTSVSPSTRSMAETTPGLRRVRVPEVVEHHGTGPDLAHRVRHPLPVMSGAEPWTGSKREGKSRSGLRLAEGAMPIVPVQAGPRSERMSPNRLEATTTSNRVRGAAPNGRPAHPPLVDQGHVGVEPDRLHRSSQNGMVWMMPLDLVAEVSSAGAGQLEGVAQNAVHRGG